MQIIARPNADAVEQISPKGTHAAQGGDAGHETDHFFAAATKKRHARHEEREKAERQEGAEGGDEIAGGGEVLQQLEGRGAGGVEEVQVLRQLQQRGTDGEEHQQDGVDHAFGHHRAEGLREGGAGIGLECTAARNLANARHYEAGGIGHEDGIGADAQGGMLIEGAQRQPPTQGAKHRGNDTESQREQHPTPMHRGEHLVGGTPIVAAIHPPENADSHSKRDNKLDNVDKWFHADVVFL